MPRARTTAQEEPNQAMLGVVQALARAAALADYNRLNRQTAGQGNHDTDQGAADGRDLRAFQLR
jgi:hypothetical protein